MINVLAIATDGYINTTNNIITPVTLSTRGYIVIDGGGVIPEPPIFSPPSGGTGFGGGGLYFDNDSLSSMDKGEIVRFDKDKNVFKVNTKLIKSQNDVLMAVIKVFMKWKDERDF